MKLRVVEKTNIAAGVVRLGLAAIDAAPLPAFQPGAHIEVQAASYPRRYSLTSLTASRDRYEICVLRTQPSRGGSTYIHDTLVVDDILDVSGPFNAFPLDQAAEHSVFIAGGIGITPFYSMTAALRALGKSHEIHYAVRTRDRMLPVDPFGDRVTVYADNKPGSGLDIGALLKSISTNAHLYACGPQQMIDATRTRAQEFGWMPNRVHFESFGSQLHTGDAPITVRLARSEFSIRIEPGTSILDALLEHGVWANFECRRGECASCWTTVIAGVPDHRDVCLTADQRRMGLCTCVSWASSSTLVLDI